MSCTQFDSIEVAIKTVTTVGANEFHNTEYASTVCCATIPIDRWRCSCYYCYRCCCCWWWWRCSSLSDRSTAQIPGVLPAKMKVCRQFSFSVPTKISNSLPSLTVAGSTFSIHHSVCRVVAPDIGVVAELPTRSNMHVL
jgi:hypothetical protein